MTKPILPFFQHDFQHTVWQTAIEPEKGLLAVELRDQQQAETSFSLLDLHARTFIFDRYALEEDWWVGLAAMQNNSMLIKQYHDSQQPGNQGMIAVNIQTKEIDWWKEDFQLVEVMDQAVKGFTTVNEERKLIVLNLSDGSELAPDNLRPLAAFSAIRDPLHYTEPSSHFSTVKDFIADKVNMVPVGGCDYLELDKLIILSVFVREADALTNQLLVFDKSGEIVLLQKLGTGLSSLASGTFFVFNNYLVFIANKTQLCVYELPSDF